MSEIPHVIFVGGGLAGSLTALKCLDDSPALTATIIEKSAEICGDHTWSFNLSDIAPEHHSALDNIVAFQWPEYSVRFPKLKRTLRIPYLTCHSQSLRSALQPHIESGRLQVITDETVSAMSSRTVTLQNGRVLKAECVFDARGFKPIPEKVLGFQKFVGLTLKTAEPHGLKNPIIMDATVDQIEGYRFVYCLPFSDTEILIEDTYYTDGPELNSQILDSRIKAYARDRLNIHTYKIVRREKGVLPITLAVDKNYGTRVEDDGASPVELGMRGGYYHAVTGYSFPEAMKSAVLVSTLLSKNYPNFHDAVRHEMIYHKADHYYEERFMRLLNRMLFRAAKPTERYKVLQRFYGLSEGLVSRFYKNRLTKADKVRILAGKPPVPVTKALYNFNENAFMKRETLQRNESHDSEP